jgi:hypothetical protein
MQLDLDRFHPNGWSPDYEHRVFLLDAFLCHRRHDGVSAKLAAQLEALRVRAWYDRDQNVADWRVKETVSKAIVHARYLVVCTAAQALDSSWCLAEYTSGLRAEREFGIPRVLVAELLPGPSIPEALRAQPLFVCHDGGQFSSATSGFRDLSRRLTHDNSIHGLPTPSGPSEPLLDRKEEEWLIKAALTKPSHWTDTRVGLLCKAFAEKLTATNARAAISTQGTAVTIHAIDIILPSLDMSDLLSSCDVVGEQRFLRASALRLASSHDSNDRADALRVLIGLDPFTRPDLLRLLSRERHAGVIGIAAPWLTAHHGEFAHQDRNVLLTAVLRAPFSFRAHSSILNLPQPLRLRILLDHALDLDLLPVSERLHIVEEQLDYLLGDAPIPADRDDWASFRPGFVELALRELYDDFRSVLDQTGIQPSIQSVSTLQLALDVLGKVVAHSETHNAEPMSLLPEWEVWNLLFKPLAEASRVATLEQQARSLFDSAALVIGQQMGWTDIADMYRQLRDIVLAHETDAAVSMRHVTLRDRVFRVREQAQSHEPR